MLTVAPLTSGPQCLWQGKLAARESWDSYYTADLISLLYSRPGALFPSNSPATLLSPPPPATGGAAEPALTPHSHVQGRTLPRRDLLFRLLAGQALDTRAPQRSSAHR
jgi:hypothetical protein